MTDDSAPFSVGDRVELSSDAPTIARGRRGFIFSNNVAFGWSHVKIDRDDPVDYATCSWQYLRKLTPLEQLAEAGATFLSHGPH